MGCMVNRYTKKIHGLHPAGPVYIELLLKGISDPTIGHLQVLQS